MYTLVYSKTFRKMLKRLRSSGRFNEQALLVFLNLLISGELIAPEYSDHQLQGDLSRLRDCHISGNLLLLYSRDKIAKEIILVKIGTHSEIFGN